MVVGINSGGKAHPSTNNKTANTIIVLAITRLKGKRRVEGYYLT
jgi:hypothetical protein